MTLTATHRRASLLWFAGASAAILAAEFAVVASTAFQRHPDLVAAAITADLTLVVPLLWYLLAVRRGGLPLVTVVPAFLLVTAAAGVVLPASAHRWLDIVHYLAPPLELAAIVFVAIRVRAARRTFRAAGGDDALTAMRAAVAEIAGNGRIADLIAGEIAVMYYALLTWRQRPPLGANHFSYHRRSGYGAVLGAFALALVAESIVVHIVVGLWSVVVAWFLTAGSIYGILLIAAEYRASALRSIAIADGVLLLRQGLRWTARIPLADILSIAPAAAADATRADGRLRAFVLGRPQLVLRLDAPHIATGPFGLTRRFDTVALAVDDAPGFTQAIRRIMNDEC